MFAPFVKSRFWEISITKERGSHIVNNTFTNFSEICASDAANPVVLKCFRLYKKHGAQNVSLAVYAIRRWIKSEHFDFSYLPYSLSVTSVLIMIFRTKFYEFDMKPTCKRCYDRFPTELKKRISDNLKEKDVETLRRRSQSPARKPPPPQQ